MNALVDTLRNLGPVRLAAMAAVGAALLAFFIYLSARLAGPELELLYGELEPQDANQIASHLDQIGVPYTLDLETRRILVPGDKVASLRLAMAEEGLPSGGSMGYEIFDRSEGLGTTNFVQNINHVRALEGELARTIRSIAFVKHARVHLVLPQRELFSRDRQQPSASIVVTMAGNRRLDRQQVLAIQHLIAAAVPGLEPGLISIVDNKGTLLARGAKEDDLETAANTAEEMQISYENRLARTLEELIERSAGVGNVRAEVSAEMDFSRVTENAEIYDPDGQVVRSTQTVEEASGSRDGQTTPPVTVGNNLPDANLPPIGGESGSESNSSRTEETVNYEISRKVTTHVRETGLVRRLSVAVLVNGRSVTDADGNKTYQPRSPEEMESLNALVRSAVGYNQERGDSIELVNLPFVDFEAEVAESDPLALFGFARSEVMRVVEIGMLGIVAILVLLLVVRPMINRMTESAASGEAGEAGPSLLPDPTGSRPLLSAPGVPGGLPALPGQADHAGYQGGSALQTGFEDEESNIEQMIDLNKVEGRVRASSIRKIGEIVEKHPEEAVAILRSWIYQET